MFVKRLNVVVAFAAAFGTSTASPFPWRPEEPLSQRAVDEPCNQLRETVQRWFRDHNIVPKNLTRAEAILIPAVPAVPVKPSLAYACLKSMPLDRDIALHQVQTLRPYWEWQSTIDYTRVPPKGYLSEGVDIFKGLDDISAKLRTNSTPYTSFFDFLTDLHILQGRARDFHFLSLPVLLDLFTFVPSVKFVSISKDGQALPEIFLYEDYKHKQSGYKPSPVSAIDDTPALEFLQKLAVHDFSSHDPDARFNGFFPSVSSKANLFAAPVESWFNGLALNDTTTVMCQNGTVFTFHNTALVRANLTNITSGSDLYRQFGLTGGQGTQPHSLWIYAASERGYAVDWTITDGFPKPINTTLGGDFAGFNILSNEFNDTAILAVNSFSGPTFDINNISAVLDTYGESSRVTVDFIRAAKAAGRTRLILDLQGNSGGSIANLAALYFSLFPGSTLPVQFQARAHPQLPWLLAQRNASNFTLPWVFQIYRRLDNTPFPSASSFIGPVITPFGNTTTPATWDENYVLPAHLNFTLPWNSPPFHPSNITILTDGRCGSACAMVVTMLTHAHGVRTVAIGGRPLLTPMQAIGQTKGGPVVNFKAFPYNETLTSAPPTIELITSEPGPIRLTSPGTSQQGISKWREGIRFNLANAAPLGDKEDAVPLQFRYEAANCRIFFTWEMARNITAIWRKVTEVAWHGGTCVEGSTTEEGGKMGRIPEYQEGVEDRYKLGDGPGAL